MSPNVPYDCPAFKDQTAPFSVLQMLHELAILPYYYQGYRNEKEYRQRALLSFAIADERLALEVIDKLKLNSDILAYGARLWITTDHGELWYKHIEGFQTECHILSQKQHHTRWRDRSFMVVHDATYLRDNNKFFGLIAMRKSSPFIFDVASSPWSQDINIINIILDIAGRFWQNIFRCEMDRMSPPPSRCFLTDLPGEILQWIASLLTMKSQTNLRLCCKTLNDWISSREFKVNVTKGGIRSTESCLQQYPEIIPKIDTITFRLFWDSSFRLDDYYSLDRITKSFSRCKYLNIVYPPEAYWRVEEVIDNFRKDWETRFDVRYNIPEHISGHYRGVLQSKPTPKGTFACLTLRCFFKHNLHQSDWATWSRLPVIPNIVELRIINTADWEAAIVGQLKEYTIPVNSPYSNRQVLELVKLLSPGVLQSLLICGWSLTNDEVRRVCQKKETCQRRFRNLAVFAHVVNVSLYSGLRTSDGIIRGSI